MLWPSREVTFSANRPALLVLKPQRAATGSHTLNNEKTLLGGVAGYVPLFTNHALGHFQTKPSKRGVHLSTIDFYLAVYCKFGLRHNERPGPQIAVWKSTGPALHHLCLQFSISDAIPSDATTTTSHCIPFFIFQTVSDSPL